MAVDVQWDQSITPLLGMGARHKHHQDCHKPLRQFHQLPRDLPRHVRGQPLRQRRMRRDVAVQSAERGLCRVHGLPTAGDTPPNAEHVTPETTSCQLSHITFRAQKPALSPRMHNLEAGL